MQQVTVKTVDIIKAAFLVTTLPFVLSFAIAKRWLTGRRDVSFKTYLLITVLRHISTVSLALKRRAVSLIDVNAILSSPRFRQAKNLCEHVDIQDFQGYWVCQGGLQTYKSPSECDIVLFYIHGGAYVLGHPLMSVAMLLRIAELVEANGLSIAIFSLRYSLAPEHTFPEPFNQGIAAHRYMLQAMRIDPKKIVLAGESAGGHLAMTMLQHMTYSRPGGVMLLYPWVDLTNSGNSIERNRHKDVLYRGELDSAVRQATAGLAAFEDILDYSKPRSQGHWLSTLPEKIWVAIGSHDIFLDSVVSFVTNAQQDGSDIAFDIFQGKPHGWLTIADVLSRRKYLESAPGDDVEGLMQGSAMIAQKLLILRQEQPHRSISATP